MDTLGMVGMVLSALTVLIILIYLCWRCCLSSYGADVSQQQPVAKPRPFHDVEAGLQDKTRRAPQIPAEKILYGDSSRWKSSAAPLPRRDLSQPPPDQPKPPQIHPQLNKAVKIKHIDPNCRSKEDAERKSLERDSMYPQEVGEINTVFQVSPEDFVLETNPTYGRVLKSREKVRNWSCKKISETQYEGRPESMMHAVFHLPEEGCHYSPGESRKTKMPRSLSRNLRGNSKSLSRSRGTVQGNRRNRGNLRGNSRSVSRSRSRIRT